MPISLKKRFSLAWRAFFEGQALPSNRQFIPAISDEEVAEIKAFFPREKFFIFGHARSGTTLLVRLLRLHPEVHCNYQAHFFTRPPLLQSLVEDEKVEAWLTRRSNRWNRGGDLSPVVLRAMSDIILERDARLVDKRIVGDKSPNSLLNGEAVHLLRKVYPDACLIFIVRDGRDAAVSHRFQTFIDSPQHLHVADLSILQDFSRDPKPFLNGKRSIFTHNGIHNAARGWVDNVEGTDSNGKALFAERYISLRFEDLLRQPWEEISRLWGFLGADLSLPGLGAAVQTEMAENPDADWQQQKAGSLVKPVKKGISGTWQELFTERDRQTFKRIAGPTLVAWEYENDLDW
ncbi:MAG: hypothetical protein A2W36_04055 [Chloroflexi bacterium RBG_16_58_14]|nr:MAG: hypothetical protein A2W36_04055 [Chloroflexi bacterium RBG_16_58_14]